MVNDDCKLWKIKPATEKILTHFKIYFALVHEELVESNQTAQATGFYTNNATVQRDTVNTIDNLGNVTIADRDPIAALALTVSSQTVALVEANTKLVRALAQITVLTREFGVSRGNISRRDPLQPAPAGKYCHYCWTHGPTCSHPSPERNRKATRHKEEASFTNKMGGRTEKWRYCAPC